MKILQSISIREAKCPNNTAFITKPIRIAKNFLMEIQSIRWMSQPNPWEEEVAKKRKHNSLISKITEYKLQINNDKLLEKELTLFIETRA